MNGLSFDARFDQVFHAQFPRLFRYFDRLSGDPELAADLAQDALVRLYRRGSFPDQPDAWLITVAMNQFRNLRSNGSRRRLLLTDERGTRAHSDPAPRPDDVVDATEQEQVRAALAHLSERDTRLLLLRAEGYAYRDIASALDLNEASVGTLLARAKTAFRHAYDEAARAPRR
jgi:RNA polymerase sigma factor (sigma-70 family)